LRTLVIAFHLLGFLFSLGCGGSASSPPAGVVRTGAPAGAPVGAAAAQPAEKLPELSVPRLAPKPVIWREDWKEEEDELPPARIEAKDLTRRADRLKSAGEYAEAEKFYQQAMTADATWAYPPYQLACNYELSGQHDRAVTEYMKAMTLGFDDFPTALADDELGRIREESNFHSTLLAIRQRYLASGETRVGQPIAFHALSAKPPQGWPMMMLLHGYGDTNISYLDHAHEWAQLGFVAVAVPGSVPASDGRYQWAMDSTEPTHQDLQAIINSPSFDGLVNREQVFLLGFSQGALHAMLLTAEHPGKYAGVVALSPGGSLADRLGSPPLNRTERPARCMFIHGEREPHAPLVRNWSSACRDAGWQFDSKTHPGGHQFPENWDELQPEIAKFLTK